MSNQRDHILGTFFLQSCFLSILLLTFNFSCRFTLRFLFCKLGIILFFPDQISFIFRLFIVFFLLRSLSRFFFCCSCFTRKASYFACLSYLACNALRSSSFSLLQLRFLLGFSKFFLFLRVQFCSICGLLFLLFFLLFERTALLLQPLP